jgi:hypothetical protein
MRLAIDSDADVSKVSLLPPVVSADHPEIEAMSNLVVAVAVKGRLFAWNS